jgi:membrane protease YdiL (CAAX protease family)
MEVKILIDNLNKPNSSSENTDHPLKSNDFLYIFAILLIILACFDLVGSLLGMGIWFMIRSELLTITESNSSILNLIVNLGAQLGGFFGFLILLQMKKLEPETKTAPQGQYAFTTYGLYALNFAFGMLIVVGSYIFLEELLGLSTDSPYESLSPTQSSLGDPVYIILFVGVLVVGAPIFEELVFRKTLIPLLERRGLGYFWVLLISSSIFSLRHTPADLLSGSIGFAIAHLFTTFLGGLALGYLYLRTRSVIWPILLHALINGLSVLAQIADAYYGPITEETVDIGIFVYLGLWAMAALLVGFAIMFYYSYQFFLRRKHAEKPIWMQILLDKGVIKENLVKISQYLIIFIVFTGGVPIIFEYIEDFVVPPTISTTADIDLLLATYFIEIAFYLIVLFAAVLFIRRLAGPVLKPKFVSSTLLKMDPYDKRPSIRSWSPQMIDKPSKSVCTSCGNIILENAQFCAFCGHKFEEEDKEGWI